MKKLFLLFLLLPILSNAQVKLDSLWGVWNDQSQADTNRLNAMYDISWDGYLFSQPDSAFYFAQLEYNYAKEKGLKKYIAQALNTQGVSFAIKGDNAKALDYYMSSLKIFEEIVDNRGIASSLNNIGIIYKNQGEKVKVLDYYMRSLKIREEIGDKQGIASSLNNIGGIYYEAGDYAEAIDFFVQSLKIKEEVGNKQGIANALNNIGSIYKDQGNYAKAIDYNERSLKIFEEISDKLGIANSLNNIGAIHFDQDAMTKAMDFHLQALKIFEEIGDELRSSAALNNIGEIYHKQGEMTKAFDFQTRALKIQEEIGDKRGMANSLNNIGMFYQEQGDYAKAIDYASRALTIAQEIDVLIRIKAAASILWQSNEKLGRYQPALEMYHLYVSSKDSLESEENQKEVIRQEFKYNYEKEALADSIKNAEAQKVLDAQIEAQTAELKQERTQRFALYGGVVLLLFFGGFIFNRYKQSQSQKLVIQQQKEIVEEAHKEITDSIQYAKRIQNAILPPNKLVKQYLPNSFILYKPKDVVAGDFYWTEHKDGKVLFAAADCTGHGVPGAMVSVVCNNGLNRSVREYGLTDPGKILDKTREIVIAEFEKSEDDVQDGMDIALCTLAGNTLKYAGAHNPLWIIRNGEIIETKADKQPIGKYENLLPYTTHTIELQKGDSIYIFSDGYVDQFGGEKGKKFKTVALKKLLLSIQEKTMDEQRELIDKTFESWRGDLEQIDDVCVMGVRV